jgi:hypothetical protein
MQSVPEDGTRFGLILSLLREPSQFAAAEKEGC